ADLEIEGSYVRDVAFRSSAVFLQQCSYLSQVLAEASGGHSHD
ncbi:ABC transporter ATP-binding protein, partial [Acinetobacter baumannii]|nr:ABC transporter ATP-binding protein [Acinetobacter baumannii]